jgi:tetratricopeptide (TPR) repeat protein
MRRLTAEQDNMHAALRWAIDRRDAALALRFGQALGWFWLLRGQRRESGSLAREILAISEAAGKAAVADGGFDVVHARAVCALTSLNSNWEITTIRQPLADVESLMTRPGAGDERPGGRPLHPLVVVGIVMLALYDKRDPDEALRQLAMHFESADPWTRSGARLMHAFSSMALGRLDDVARECAEALGGFEALGDRWGMALALVGQSELAALDGDHTRAIAVLERAVKLSGELTDWEDTAQMHASLAKSRSRLGDHRGALADMARAERAARCQGDSETELWIVYVKAELAWLRGDLAEAGQLARRLDARMAGKNAAMIGSLRAQAQNRGALVDIRLGDLDGGLAGLASALHLARDSMDLSSLAVVIDGVAAAALWTDPGRYDAERAATLLGAAHSLRGAFDHSSLDAPETRDAARRTLGEAAFDAAYQRGRGLGPEEAFTLAEDAVGSSASL